MIDFYNQLIPKIKRELGILLYRMAETAPTEKRLQIKQQAETFLLEKDYTSFVERRIGKGDGFKITETDLGHINS